MAVAGEVVWKIYVDGARQMRDWSLCIIQFKTKVVQSPIC